MSVDKKQHEQFLQYCDDRVSDFMARDVMEAKNTLVGMNNALDVWDFQALGHIRVYLPSMSRMARLRIGYAALVLRGMGFEVSEPRLCPRGSYELMQWVIVGATRYE